MPHGYASFTLCGEESFLVPARANYISFPRLNKSVLLFLQSVVSGTRTGQALATITPIPIWQTRRGRTRRRLRSTLQPHVRRLRVSEVKWPHLVLQVCYLCTGLSIFIISLCCRGIQAQVIT